MSLRVLAAAAILAAAVASGPFDPGQYTVATTSGKCGNDSKWDYNVWAPDTAGPFPVMVYLTGLGGVVPGSTYSELASTIAAKGVYVVTLWRLSSPAPRADAVLLAKALPWLEANLPGAGGLKATPDFGSLVLSGHSAGNHVWCDYLNTQCGKVKAVVMMDPVDGFDPFGIVKNYCITPGQKLAWKLPGLLLRTGLDPVSKSALEPACAPAKLANDRFYDAWAGPVWLANATKYGHLDVNNDDVKSIGGLVCPGDKEAAGPYRTQVAGLTYAFLSMVLSSDNEAEHVLTNATAMPVATVALHDYNGATAPFSNGCARA